MIESGNSHFEYPVTIVIRHRKERKSKCTVQPLRGRADFQFFSHPPREMPHMDGYIRLSPSGPPLSNVDADKGLLILDGTWRWAESMMRQYEHVPARSLTGYTTAYPRVSKLFTDPDGGLATVEAIYLAYRTLGRPTDGLLDEYRWKDEFLENVYLRLLAG